MWKKSVLSCQFPKLRYIYSTHLTHTQSMIACGLNALILGKGQFFKEDFITSKMLNKRMNPNPRFCAQ